MSYVDDVDHLEAQLPSLKNSRKAFIGHVTRLLNKIHEAKENLENTEKVLCLTKQLNVIFEKLKGTIFNFIELSLSPEEIENANEILCEQKILELLKFRTLSKIILKHHPKLQKFVLQKCPDLQKVPPRGVLVVQVTRKVCT